MYSYIYMHVPVYALVGKYNTSRQLLYKAIVFYYFIKIVATA